MDASLSMSTSTCIDAHPVMRWMHLSFDGWMDGWMCQNVIYLIVKEMKREGSTRARALIAFT